METQQSIKAPKGRLLVKEVKLENKTSGGIILETNNDPDNTARYGEVVSNGISVNDSHLNKDYSVGVKLFFGKFSGTTVVYSSEKYVSLTENEIVAIVA